MVSLVMCKSLHMLMFIWTKESMYRKIKISNDTHHSDELNNSGYLPTSDCQSSFRTFPDLMQCSECPGACCAFGGTVSGLRVAGPLRSSLHQPSEQWRQWSRL